MNKYDILKALNCSNEEDLLRHFPSKYEDLSLSDMSLPLKDKGRYVFKGEVVYKKDLGLRRTSIIRLKVRIYTGSILDCIIFNQPYYMMKLSKSNTLLFVTYYQENRHAFSIKSIYDLDNLFVINKIKPIYSLPKGISSTTISNMIINFFSYNKGIYLTSPLPKRLVEKYRFIDESDAYRMVHIPKSYEELKLALRVFKYEEALAYSINSLEIKKEAEARKRETIVTIDHMKINSFVSSLKFKLTSDQNKSIREIVLDLESSKVMYRLLQGDVGTGKTMVAFVSLYANYLKKKQGVLMAPTIELAKQHYNNALKVFEKYPIKIALLLGSMSIKEKRGVLEGLKDGSIDILISTNSAISKNVEFKDLGLSIVDEQQLFGVAQRKEILAKGAGVDLLMMSATPIPRTLSQIVNADISVSTLETFPNGQRKVETRVVKSTDPIIRKAIDKALKASRQIFIVAPKIEEGTSDSSSAVKIYEEMKEIYTSSKVQLLHGKIKKDERDEIYNRFVSGEKPILVSTTVIEVGIDVSKAGLLIVYDANYFGLSTLHQLRGRIGRSGDYALCLLIYDKDDKEAIDKLNFLASSNDGLRIAEYDLKMRGSGSYSGEKQSGNSELSICNFVDDSKIFIAAKSDAIEILRDPKEKENAAYLNSLNDQKVFVC